MPGCDIGKAALTSGVQHECMAWLLLLLIPLVGLPVLRMVLFPVPRRMGFGLPWPVIGIGAVLVGLLWMGASQKQADPAESYAQADSAMRALIE